MDNAKKFFEEVIKTEEAKAIFASLKKPETEEETFELYSEIAGKLGIELSEEEIRAYLDENAPSGELDDEELSQLSGGGDHDNCKDTFRDYENCWWEDGCDRAFNRYDGYGCGKNYYIIIDGQKTKRCTKLIYVAEP